MAETFFSQKGQSNEVVQENSSCLLTAKILWLHVYLSGTFKNNLQSRKTTWENELVNELEIEWQYGKDTLPWECAQ